MTAPKVVAHLIIGARPEPYLEALLQSLQGVARALIVNENSGLATTENTAVLQASHFSRSGTLTIDRAPFLNFSDARNRCMLIHEQRYPDDWVAFVDADEVHDEQAVRIAQGLSILPQDVTAVDGYTRHFFQSYNFYLATERRLSFFRYRPGLRWYGAVHEQLPLTGRRLPLPYVYFHYGHLRSARDHAEKGRQYSGLGADGEIVALDRLNQVEAATYFQAYWNKLLRFHGQHPKSIRALIKGLDSAECQRLGDAELLIKVNQGRGWSSVERGFWNINYELRWRSRSCSLLALRCMSGSG